MIFFSVFFYLRRFILALTVIYLKSNLVWQFFSMALQYVTKLMQLGLIRPLKTVSMNNWEMFNECMIMVVMYFMLCFSDAMPDLETQS